MKISKLALVYLSITSILQTEAFSRIGLAPPHKTKIRTENTTPITAFISPSRSTTLHLHPERRTILRQITTLPFLYLDDQTPGVPSSATNTEQQQTPLPLADLPMIRLKLPQPSFGREYVVIRLKLKNQGPFDFMVDSGLTTELITPHLRNVVGIDDAPIRPINVKGIAAGGDTGAGSLIDLEGASLCCGEFSDPNDAKELPLPVLHAIVTDFPQEHIDPNHDPVEGMLGMELLSLFDVDFDFKGERLRFWKPGTVASVASRKKMTAIPAGVLNETGLWGVRVTSTGVFPNGQPVIGIVDCGASFSTVNWAAAKYLGLPPRGDPSYGSGPEIVTLGVDGRPLTLSTAEVRFTFVGDASRDEEGRVRFDPPPESWRPWDPVQVGVGDLPVFEQLLGDGRTKFQGPAVLLGLDVLSQRRLILETGEGRRRRLFVDPK